MPFVTSRVVLDGLNDLVVRLPIELRDARATMMVP
jgi:hypothetical protein